ncbi:DUF1059 domain-containing protein [uncultured Psychromonas sp.]|uniref:DUF1059 domain-containing protein n=1 Tax=uncultured Psychromonas sp. TaxID=173974 RepID=UPI00261BCECA|nr:DUF1059 domain-containing protein [uncultured Psychromonas sp.]
MKTMSCKQLGGACEQSFQAKTFEELVEQSKLHAMEMFMQQDEGHLEAMQKIQALMKDPAAIQAWYDAKEQEFNALVED